MKLLYFIGSLYCLNGESCFLAVRLEAKHIKRNKSNNEVRNIMPLNASLFEFVFYSNEKTPKGN